MVGTDDLRRLLTATTRAGVKTVLIGDQHQLAPVKARGGMFTQLCTDLPWTQHLSEVWRIRDADERTASLALRNGGPASVRRAIGWYRTHDRLHCGDVITMAADALAAHQADIAAGKDAILVCDTTEMADALNQRIHHDTITADAPTVTGARGHRIAVGDLIVSRRNDAAVSIYDAASDVLPVDAVRNGNRWQVAAIDTEGNRIAARRLSDGARAVFEDHYVREHITHGYAVTVHSAQGVTADTTHAVLSENATRALSYVAMTRGRQANTVYLYQRNTEHEHPQDSTETDHLTVRGSSQHTVRLLRAIVANDEHPITAHDLASTAADQMLPDHVRGAIEHRTAAIRLRANDYERWRAAASTLDNAGRAAHSRDICADRSIDDGLEF